MQNKFFVIAALLLTMTGCALRDQHGEKPNSSPLYQVVPPALTKSIVAVADCAQLVNSTNKEVAAALDINVDMLATLRQFGQTDNSGVCVMPWDKRNELLLAYRKTIKNPNRQATRAASKEYIASWDADDNGKQPTSSQKIAADNARRAMAAKNATTNKNKAAGISPNQWTFLGPGNVGGRIRAIVFDPRNSNRFFIGSATGGVWITDNGGQTITPVVDFGGNIAIGSMAIDSVNPNNIYAGTGEYSTGFSGAGVVKSVDGGVTWNFLSSTSTDTSLNPSGADWVFTNRIQVHPTNASIVLAANSGGIYRSTNGGQAWVRVKTGVTLDLQIDPNNPANMVASGNGGFAYFSRDGGLTWTDAPKYFDNALRGRSSTARSEFAWSKSTPDLVYASVDNSDQTTGARGEIYKSEDGGATWTFLSSPKHLNQQGDYDNTIWVDPTNAQNIVTGGLDLYRSIDGGLNFTRISTWQSASPGQPQPHADHHQLVSPPNYSAANPVVYNGNDGGLYRSTNIFAAGPNGTTTWQNLNNELGVTQFYGGAGSVAAGGKLIGGTQDNGDLRFSAGTTWARVGGGDGGYAAVDPIDDNTYYGEYVYASIRRYGGAGGGYICTGILEGKKTEGSITYCGPNATERSNFITPFILDPNVRDRMLVGADSLWVSDDVRTVVAPVWRSIKPPVSVSGNSRYFINAIAVQNGNSDIIWVGHNASNTTGVPTGIFKTTNGQSATPTWINMTQPGMSTSAINRITIDPDNPNRVWVAYTGFSTNRLWVTDNGGTTWRSISAGLPAVTLHDVKRHPTQRDWLYVAAANGVYTSQDSGLTWTSTNDGPNSVRVRELFWYDQFTLVAVTFGRGFYKAATLPDTGLVSFQPVSYTVGEGAGNVTLLVQRIGSIASAASVRYASVVGTGAAAATAGEDFTAVSGTLSWAAGDGSTKTIVVPIIDDALAEQTETFSVLLSNAVGTTIGASSATVNITDNEAGVFPPNCVMPTTGWSTPAGATVGWQVATDSAAEGQCSLKNLPLIDGGTGAANVSRAQIQFSGNFVAGNVTFARRVSSEDTFDCLRFLIDGVQQNIGGQCSAIGGTGASGEVPWGNVSIPISAGMRTLTWSYEKDRDTVSGADSAWIDALVLPLAGGQPPVTPPTKPQFDYSDMWWAGSTESGWGMSIQQHANNVQFNALYVYDNTGRPVWYVMPGGTWSNNFTTYTGPIYQPTGAPLNNYNAASIVVGASPGTVTINFTGQNTATLTYTINGISGTKSISRQSFAAGTAPFVVNDLWWANTAENGWGINLAQQQGTIFAVWYTYALDGKATWLVMPGGAWNGNTYSGNLFTTTGAQWLGATFSASSVVATNVGTLSFDFANANAATMRYNLTAGPFQGTNQTKQIVRQGF
jgi:hypothetical protein